MKNARGFSALRHKLVFKIPFQTCVAIFILLAIIIMGVLTPSLLRDQTKELNVKSELIAESNSIMISSYLDNMQKQSDNLAAACSAVAHTNMSDADHVFKSFMNNALEDENLFSVYIALEPNAAFPDTPHGLSYYLYRSGQSFTLDVENDYDVYNVEKYYYITKETLAPYLTEPYDVELTSGETVKLITFCSPILDEQGNFLGVTNCDMLLDSIGGLDYEDGGYQTAANYLISSEGIFLANTSDNSKLGTKFSDSSKDFQDILQQLSEGNKVVFEDTTLPTGEDGFEVFTPLKINGSNQTYASVYLVGTDETKMGIMQIVRFVNILGVIAIIVLTAFCALITSHSLKPLEKVVEKANQMRNGDLSTAIEVNTEDELGKLSKMFQDTSNTLGAYAGDVIRILTAISNGDLTSEIEQDFAGDFAPMKEALICILTNLNEMMEQIQQSANVVSLGSQQVSDGAQMLAQGATEQASSVEQLYASVEQVSNDVTHNLGNVELAASCINDTVKSVQESTANMDNMLTAMNNISSTSEQITGIIKVIDNIAFQTNILALNAAVEAARAGSYGKGFAVVAEEVRNLAAKSAEAAKQTAQLIISSAEAVTEGSQLAELTSQTLFEVANKSEQAQNSIQKISVASSQQAAALTEIKIGLNQVSTVVQTNSATAEESAASSEELLTQSRLLREQVSHFKRKQQQY